MSTLPGDVTRLLSEIDHGNISARDELLEVAYAELRQLAGGLMRRERAGHTLQATALVHEAALRIFGPDEARAMPNRSYFFAAMAQAMRRILVEHARMRSAQRRGGNRGRVPLDDVVAAVEQAQQVDLLDLDNSLRALAAVDHRASSVVTLRFFGGMEMNDIAFHLDVSVSTVERDWRFARAWLRKAMASEGRDHA